MFSLISAQTIACGRCRMTLFLGPHARFRLAAGARKDMSIRPLWQESVVIVCKEVDNLAHVQPSRVTTDSPESLRYRLCRITTLKWNPDISSGPDFDPNNCWLPFKPSLEHMRSVACRADGPTEEIPTYSIGRTKTIVATFPCPTDVFCDPEADAGLLIQQNGRHEWGMCSAYEVYLV